MNGSKKTIQRKLFNTVNCQVLVLDCLVEHLSTNSQQILKTKYQRSRKISILGQRFGPNRLLYHCISLIKRKLQHQYSSQCNGQCTSYKIPTIVTRPHLLHPFIGSGGSRCRQQQAMMNVMVKPVIIDGRMINNSLRGSSHTALITTY